MFLKTFFICNLFVAQGLNISAQITFKQAVSYLHMPYDSLDEILVKKGYSFNETAKLPGNGTNASWKNSKGFLIGISSIPDTVTLLFEGRYNGYTDVLKKSVIYAFLGTNIYDLFIEELKNKLTKFQTWTEESSIVTTYKSATYFAKVTKKVTNMQNYYFIKIDDLAYEILEQHYK